MISQEELINALKLIKEICESHTACRNCPLRNEGSECKLETSAPDGWELNEPTEWKAFK